jgi:hypothetical protein
MPSDPTLEMGDPLQSCVPAGFGFARDQTLGRVDEFVASGGQGGVVRRAYVDGPVGARGEGKEFRSGAVAVVCRACMLRHAAAGPDGFRDPLPNGKVTLLAATLHGFCGSSDRPISICPSKPLHRGKNERQAAGCGR